MSRAVSSVATWRNNDHGGGFIELKYGSAELETAFTRPSLRGCDIIGASSRAGTKRRQAAALQNKITFLISRVSGQ